MTQVASNRVVAASVAFIGLVAIVAAWFLPIAAPGAPGSPTISLMSLQSVIPWLVWNLIEMIGMVAVPAAALVALKHSDRRVHRFVAGLLVSSAAAAATRFVAGWALVAGRDTFPHIGVFVGILGAALVAGAGAWLCRTGDAPGQRRASPVWRVIGALGVFAVGTSLILPWTNDGLPIVGIDDGLEIVLWTSLMPGVLMAFAAAGLLPAVTRDDGHYDGVIAGAGLQLLVFFAATAGLAANESYGGPSRSLLMGLFGTLLIVLGGLSPRLQRRA